jgi:predicted ArsR family transcriptional regulator
MVSEEKPLNERQLAIVRYVHEHGPCLYGDVAKHIRDDVTVVRTSIKYLVARGYIKKRTIFGWADATLGMGDRGHTQKMVELHPGARKLGE